MDIVVEKYVHLKNCCLLVLRYEELNFNLNNCPIYMHGGGTALW